MSKKKNKQKKNGIKNDNFNAVSPDLALNKRADFDSSIYETGSRVVNSFVQSFDGEKNTGELGPIISYIPNYYALNARSWQSYTTNEISKTILEKFIIWIIDRGLKLQANPQKNILKKFGIELETEDFNEEVETFFSVWAKSKRSSLNGMDNLHSLAKECYKNSKIGGDVLVVLTYDETLKVQLIDGALIYSNFNSISSDGNKIIDGVEVDKYGKHIAYHVNIKGSSKPIKAYNSVGIQTAFLVYGNKHRLNSYRGMPAIAVVLESLKKLERYKDAAIGSAEERQKIAYSIEHEVFSDGSNPLLDSVSIAYDLDGSGKNVPVDVEGKALASYVATTSNKQTYNMPRGAKLKALESRNELFFKEFHETNADLMCAAVGIPPNVAFSIYNDSFSASRAATKDWDHTIDVNRDDFVFQFYQPIFNFFLHIHILKGLINAPKYVESFASDNFWVVEAYRNCRFTGPMFPHIDPKKEADAERIKLGELAKHIPLTTVENATEVLNGGDSDSNIEQFAKELELASENGLKPVVKEVDNQKKKKQDDQEDDQEELDD